MQSDSFYSDAELQQIGFQSVGKNVLISKKASLYGVSNISIGDNVRIDDFCILSGKITLKSYIHISAYTALYGGDESIFIDDFSGVSSRSTIYAITDDFSGEYMVGSMIDNQFRNILGGIVYIGKYVQLGANCVVLPNLSIKDGVAVGAMSLINKDLDSWSIYAGIPCHFIKKRKQDLLKLKDQFLQRF